MGILKNITNATKTIQAAFSGQLIQNNAELEAAKDAGWFRPSALAQKLKDKTQLEKEDLYKGIIYRALTTISNRCTQLLLSESIKLKDNTDKELELMDHPYWKAIDESKSFTNFELFFALSTYIQLAGLSPMLAVRTFGQSKEGKVTSVGEVKEFKIVSPYDLTLLLNEETGDVIGYEQVLKLPNGKTKKRSLALPEIVPIKNFNPFNNLLGYGAAQAAESTQFTMLKAGQYTRRSMRNNISTSGILTVNKLLNEAEREKFKQELQARYSSEASDGSPIIAFGADALDWKDIRQDLDKMALEKIHGINRDDLMTILGVSKTILGIEESGTTRETARVQRELLLENIVIPLVTTILEELNQDYRNSYNDKRGLKFVLESPLARDYDAEKSQSEILSVNLDVAKKMWEFGATRQSIIDSLELPEDMVFDREPSWQGTDNPNDLLLGLNPPTEPPKEPAVPDKQTISADLIPDAKNALTGEQYTKLRQLRDNLISDVTDNELDIMDAYIKSGEKETQNAIKDSQKNSYIKKLQKLLKEYYLAVVPLLASAMIEFRDKQYGLKSDFTLTAAMKKLITQRVSQTSLAHFDYVDGLVSKIIQEAVKEGWSRDKVTREIRNKFENQISVSDARRLGVTETNNAFNKSQLWADQEFLSDNGLEARAYKQLVTYGPNPCAFCLELASQPPIPFNDAFLKVGQTLEVEEGGKVKTLTPSGDYGDIEDGNVHPHCSCRYRLIIQR